MLTKITIVTVCFEAAKTIGDTIQSVASQTYSDVEYIVIDGGSKDGTIDILKSADAAVSRWVSEKDNGLYDAMNKGLALASGDYVGFLNADDFFASPTALEDIVHSIEAVDADATYGNCLIVDDQDPSVIRRYYNSRHFKPWHLRFGDIPPHASIYIKRDILLREGGFRTDFSIAADFDLLVRVFLVNKARLNYVPKILTRNRGGGISNSGLASTVQINKEIHKSLVENGIWSTPVFLWFRYFFKVKQYVSRPKRKNLASSSWFK